MSDDGSRINKPFVVPPPVVQDKRSPRLKKAMDDACGALRDTAPELIYALLVIDTNGNIHFGSNMEMEGIVQLCSQVAKRSMN